MNESFRAKEEGFKISAIRTVKPVWRLSILQRCKHTVLQLFHATSYSSASTINTRYSACWILLYPNPTRSISLPIETSLLKSCSGKYSACCIVSASCVVTIWNRIYASRSYLPSAGIRCVWLLDCYTIIRSEWHVLQCNCVGCSLTCLQTRSRLATYHSWRYLATVMPATIGPCQ